MFSLFFFSSRRRHTRCSRDWSSDVCSSDLNVVYGVVIVSLVHGAAREPSLVIGMAFGFLVIEFGFVMVTVLLSHMGLGELAWARILGGNLIGAAIAFVMLSRQHRLADGFRQ